VREDPVDHENQSQTHHPVDPVDFEAVLRQGQHPNFPTSIA